MTSIDSMINRIPFKISGRSTSSSGLFVQSNIQYDYAVGGVPFLSATSDQRPDTESTVEQRKQQFENYEDPGEYSLQQWWLRSQTSFIGGAGVIYQDPDTQGQHKNLRYSKSIGCDPFTNVDYMLLQKEFNNCTTLNNFTSNTGPAYCRVTGNVNFGDFVFIAQGNNWVINPIGTSNIPSGPVGSGTWLINPSASAASFLQGGMAVLGNTGQQSSYAYVLMQDPGNSANSGVYRLHQPLTGTPASEKIYAGAVSSVPNTWNPATYHPYTIAASRGSIFFGVDNKLYVLDPYIATGSNPLPTVSAQLPQGQSIVSITDGPDATYIGANGVNQGFIYKTLVDSTTGAVNGVQLTAVLPFGELVCDAQAYINTYMVITTTTGVRVGTFTPGFSGAIFAYGPKIITVPRQGVSGGPEGNSGFGRIAFYGSRAYFTTQGLAQHDGSYGLMAIDMSTVIQDVNTGAQFQSYSTWDYVPGTSAPLVDVTIGADGRPIATSGYGGSAVVQLEHKNNYISSGYFETGRCRFNTMEPKLFKFLSVRTPTPLQGNLDVTLLDDSGGQTPYITYGPTLDPGVMDLSTPSPTGPRNWEAFRFTLHRGQSDPTIAAQLDAWQIKGMPGNIRQRKIVRNFLCMNKETDKGGQVIMGDTYALDRLTQIRQMCQRGDTIILQDLAQNISTQVVIDDYAFTMLAPPGPNKENYGGYLTITMRTVADTVPALTFGSAESD